MSKAKWIWYKNDFEIYHNMMLHNRRLDNCVLIPTKWHLARPECAVKFWKKISCPADSKITVHTHGNGMIEFYGEGYMRFGINKEFTLPSGEYTAMVEIFDPVGFPSFYIDSEYLKTDESWTADRCDDIRLPVECVPNYTNPTDNPTVFPFVYDDISPINESAQNGGWLFDYGDEYFGPLCVFTKVSDDTVYYNYGESSYEALDVEKSLIRGTVNAKNGVVNIESSAFRYIFIRTKSGEKPKIFAKYEHLGLSDKASFRCNEPVVSDIWKMCSHTFHLNSREFYLDGIKRDRWVWSGDSYQSFIINRYLYNDKEITKRTIKALLGRPPVIQHINTINDYSAYLIIAVWEYYFASGDTEFVRSVWSGIKSLFEFIETRLIDGYVVEYEEDWVFIDWSDIDKTGAVCFEQILLWKVYCVMSELSSICGEDSDEYKDKADSIKQRIFNDYYDKERCAFIDSFESGKNHISRHANIFAVLYDFVDDEGARKIAENVLLNDNITAITTPYFKLYELMALGKLGYIELVQDYLTKYWGKMLECGATTVWEQFDPNDKGLQHYDMYNTKYAKSLCHAWGCGPIYLLGRFIAGVYATAVGGKTFTVAPNAGRYSEFESTVPVNGGTVCVKYSDGILSVLSTVEGGTLSFGGKSYIIDKDKELIVKA